MALPVISDGTVQLRPFAPSDGEEAVGWLAGPGSRDRSATDGGPAVEGDDARRLVDKLCHSDAYTVIVDEHPSGWVSLHVDGKQCGHLQLVLAHARLWNQGVGTRVVRLLQNVAFEHLELAGLAVLGIPESAEAARVSFEDAGFAMVDRRLGGEDEVLVDYHLDEVSYHATEQRVLLIHHGRTASEAEGMVLGSTMDPPLDYVGRAQAEALALSGLLYGMGECLCSPSKRARATAEQAFAAHDIPLAVCEEWRDRNWGELSGTAAAALPRSEAGLIADPRSGESDDELRRRLTQALKDLPYGHHLAVVTHGAVIACLVRMIQPSLVSAGGLASGLGLAHGSVSEIRRSPSGWRVVRINDDRHQQGRRATAESA